MARKRSVSTEVDPVMAVVLSLPKAVKVGPFDIPIVVQDEVAGEHGPAYGAFHYTADDFGILISSHSALSPHSVANTFIHECLHALIWANGIMLGDEFDEERLVTQLATGLTAIYRDNPWLGSWLKMCLQDPA